MIYIICFEVINVRIESLVLIPVNEVIMIQYLLLKLINEDSKKDSSGYFGTFCIV